MDTSTDRSLPLNRLLASLPADDYDRIAPTLDIIPLKLKDTLHKAGDVVQQLYFPGGGFVSILTVLANGSMVEVATIGREGVAGLAGGGLSDRPSPLETVVQVESDTCYRMSAVAFRREMDRRETFYDLITRYWDAFFGVVAQSTACNAVHSVEQRLARWLLLAHDRVERDSFPVTQELVAMMLGATRPTVTIVAGALQKAGLITCRRGHITIIDRAKLEMASCECYGASTDLLARVSSEHSSDTRRESVADDASGR